MEDGRKNNGGAREGAGRRPKADEIKVIEQMDAVMVPEEVWQSLAKLVRARDTTAIKTWLQYRFGMPKQIIEQTNINPDRPNIVFIKKTK
jgi:hypothetical protein